MRQDGLQALKVGPLFGRFSLGPFFAKNQKMTDLGVFPKLARIGSAGTFGKILSDVWTLSACYLGDMSTIFAEDVFQGFEFGLLFG